MNLYPVILSGGAGTRLWPMSRQAMPKQFLPLIAGKSPFQETLRRLGALSSARAPLIVANHEHRFLVAEQLRVAGIEALGLLLEPMGRNTAPAAAIAALQLVARDPDAIMLLLPADHHIPDAAAFSRTIDSGMQAAAKGRLAVFGIAPRWAETGYGYIECGPLLPDCPGCHDVAAFVEKPEQEIADRYVAGGRHYWNSGMFLFRADRFLAELERLQPELMDACRAAAGSAARDRDFLRLDASAFARCTSISIDYAIMEHTRLAALVPAQFAWSDIGSWKSLWEIHEHDTRNNVALGNVRLENVQGSYVNATRRMVVGIGLKDLVIVETPDAVLVAHQEESQKVREIVDEMRAAGRPEALVHRTVFRPWGCYEDIDAGQRFRVKRITVDPGAKLSLQMHHHRAEHWIVVSGTARITRGEEVLMLTENQSTFIPLGVTHRLENPGQIALQMIEVQSGSYLQEDDIVRFEDAYSRV